MKNKHIHKKLKLAIILNTMYLYNNPNNTHLIRTILVHVHDILSPTYHDINASAYYNMYRRIEENIEQLYDDWFAETEYIKDYANKHNIKLYPRAYFRL